MEDKVIAFPSDFPKGVNLKIENTKLKERIAFLEGKIEGLEMVIDKLKKIK